LDADFWNESNGFLETRAAIAADNRIVSGMKRIFYPWYKITQNKYPKDYHTILYDLNQARLGKGMFIRISGKSLHLIGAFMAIAQLDGLLEVIEELPDPSTISHKEMSAKTKEAALRLIGEGPQVRQVLSAAFAASANKLDKFLLAQYSNESPGDVMEGVYFRAVARYDLQTFNSPYLAQDLYHYMFDV
jgi:hypothetical protein